MWEPLGACQPQFTSVCAEEGRRGSLSRCPGPPGPALKDEEGGGGGIRSAQLKGMMTFFLGPKGGGRGKVSIICLFRLHLLQTRMEEGREEGREACLVMHTRWPATLSQGS